MPIRLLPQLISTARYTNQRNGLGAANASRMLAEINLRRGQVSYANSMMEQALRTFQSIAFRLGQVEATVGLGIIQYQRGLLDHARHTLENGRQQAHTLKNKVTECKALLSLGDVYPAVGTTQSC